MKSVLAQGGGARACRSRASPSRAAPEIDFAKFGPTELQPLNRIRKLSAANLHRSWVTCPTSRSSTPPTSPSSRASARRRARRRRPRGFKLTFLPFVVKAVCRALQELPHFNASLDRTGENLIVKRYFHIGVAVDTEHGLVVPVIRDADRQGHLRARARGCRTSRNAPAPGSSRPRTCRAASFSISSLGGIGGTAFTPIVNHPEVAILGVSKMEWRPVWRDGAFVPRLVLPLSLSYDHRVIDGADAARFTARVAELLARPAPAGAVVAAARAPGRARTRHRRLPRRRGRRGAGRAGRPRRGGGSR